MLDYQFFYLISILLLFFPTWLIFIIIRKDLHREIIITSLFGSGCGIISEIIAYRDYWRPPLIYRFPLNFGIEDILLGFFIGGIAASIYEITFGKHFTRIRSDLHNWLLILIVCLSTLIPGLLFINLRLNINSIYATFIVLFIWSLIVVFYRHDLLKDALFSAIFFSIFYFLAFLIILFIYPEAVSRYWLLDNLSGTLILGIPIEELLFAFFTGLSVGPFYEFMCGLRLKPTHPRDKLKLNTPG